MLFPRIFLITLLPPTSLHLPGALWKVITTASITVRAFPTPLGPFCFQDLFCLSEQLFWALPEPLNLLWSQANAQGSISLHRSWLWSLGSIPSVPRGAWCGKESFRNHGNVGISAKPATNCCPPRSCLSQGFPWGLEKSPVAVSSLLSCFMCFCTIHFCVLHPGIAGLGRSRIRVFFFPLLLSGILQDSWVSCLLEKLGCPAKPRAMECKSSTVISSLF